MRKIKEHEGRKYLIVHDYMLHKVLDKIKEIIGILELDDSKILIDPDGKLPNYIALKNVVILITSGIRDERHYPEIFLGKTILVVSKISSIWIF